MRKQQAWALLVLGALSGVAHADDEWASRGQVGFSRTSGNTDTTTGNLLLHVAHLTGDWKYQGLAVGARCRVRPY